MAWLTFFHLAGAVQFFFGCYYDYTYVRIPSNNPSASYGGKFKFLTFLDAMLLTGYFTIAFINDMIGTNEHTPQNKPLIRRIKDVLFSSLAFPVAMFVGTTFWGIYGIDRELILPVALDAVFPCWLNHLMHTNIVIFVLTELVSTFRAYPTREFGMSVLLTFMLCYAVWIHVVYYMSGVWVYPVLSIMNWPVRICFYILSLAIIAGLYVLGENLNNYVWGQNNEQREKKPKKKSN